MVNKYTDAERLTANKVTKTIKPDDQKGCGICGSPQCGGHHDKKPNKDGNILQSMRDVEGFDWRQSLSHPDDFTLNDFHQRMGATQQAIRDNPTIRGAVKNERAHVIGPKVRLTYEPDYEALGLSINWQMQMAAQVEDLWEHDMEDPVYMWNDAAGCSTFSGQMGLAFSECSGAGEVLGIFVEDEKESNHSPVTTKFLMLDISRLSTPYNKRTQARKRRIVEGKQLNKYGKPVGYYVSNEIPASNCFNRFTSAARAAEQLKWKYIPKFNDWNSPQVVHWYDKERTGQNRAIPDLASALKRTHMLETYEETILDAATRDAAFAMWVESDMPNVGQAFQANIGMSPSEYVEEVMGSQMQARQDYYSDRDLELKSGKGLLPQLMTTEKLRSITPGSPTDNHVNFDRAMQTAIGRSLGVDPYTFTGDMTNVNYSTIRAALLQTWTNRTFKRDAIFTHIGTPIFATWFEEKVARGQIKFPISSNRTLSHLNYFYKNRRALTMVDFCGPGQEPIDPIKGFKAQDGAIARGLQSRSRYYKQFTDTTFRKEVTRIKYEEELLKECGLEHFIGSGKTISQEANDRIPDSNLESNNSSQASREEQPVGNAKIRENY